MTDKHPDEHGSKHRRHVPPPPLRPWERAGFSFKNSEPRTKREEKMIEEGLEAIYLKGGGDLTTFDHRKRRLALRVALGALVGMLILSAVAWAGVLLFNPFATDEGPGLSLEIAGPSSVALGREETYVVRWTNRSFQPVSEVLVRVNVPPEFSLTSIDPLPSDSQSRQWNLGMITPGEEGRVTFKGIFLGETGETSALQAIGTYRKSGSDQTLDSIAVLPVTYAQSLLAGTLDLPPKIISGEAFDIVYAVSNNSEQDRAGLIARLHLPVGFVPAPTSSAAFTFIDGSYEIELPNIPANSSTTLHLTGTFVSGSSGDQLIDARIGVKSGSKSFMVLHADAKTVPVLAGDLSIRIVANGSSENRLITPGEPLRLSIAYENVSPEPILGVSLMVKFESFKDGVSATGTSWLDWTRLEDRTQAESSIRGLVQTLRYDEKVVPLLANIPPQGKGTFEITLPTLPITDKARDARIVLSYEGKIVKVGKDTVNRTLRTAPIELRYRTDAELSSEAFYFTEEGAPLGSGPLPPQAGKTTSYRVVWRINKTLHELTNPSVTAVLPPIAAWGDKTLQSAGDLTYDIATRTVRWTLNKIPHEVDELEASFEIQLTPTDLDIGRFASVLGETRLEGLDTDTGETVLRSKPPLTTDLQNDEGAKRKGVVRKAQE